MLFLLNGLVGARDTAGGAAGGAGGGGGKELVALCVLPTGLVFWFRLWFSFCAKDVDEVVGFPAKADFGATAGPEKLDAGLELPGCLLVLARSSSAQGAGGGRSPISGGGRKDSTGFGAVGGGAGGLGACGDEYWFGNFGLNGPLFSISDNKSVRESSCLSKLVCFSICLWGLTALIGTVASAEGTGGGGGGGGGEGQLGALPSNRAGGGKSSAGGGKSSTTGGGAGNAGASAADERWHSGGGAGRSSSKGGGGGGGGKSSHIDGGGGGRSPTRPITAVLAGVGEGAEGGVWLLGRGGATEANFFGWL